MYQLFQFSSKKSVLELGPSTFLRDAFLGTFFLRGNVNLMYFVGDVVIRYRVYLFV